MGAEFPLRRRAALIGAMATGIAGRAAAQAPAADDPWPSLARQIFGDRPIEDGSKLLTIDAPYRAEDAALVPVGMHLQPPEGSAGPVTAITLVIDQNPSPLAAKFSPGPDSLVRSIATRVRVDSYTNLHAVAEQGGRLYGTRRFVKAAGGCSAPAAKQEADTIPLGTMRFRRFPPSPGSKLPEAQLMIRHPNYSGMQMDQLTRLYVPAHFVTAVRIWQGGALLLAIESGISIAQNPEFRFSYHPNGATEFRAEVQDSEGKVFKDSWPAARA
jgi:sulfur-oxidizing protein SoxY